MTQDSKSWPSLKIEWLMQLFREYLQQQQQEPASQVHWQESKMEKRTQGMNKRNHKHLLSE
ncbi:hypothetical protein NFI96_031921, partial [Prochilodus magdalenae]